MSNTSLKDLWRSREQTFDEMREIVDNAEGRDLTSPEWDQFEKLSAEIDDYDEEIRNRILDSDGGKRVGERAFDTDNGINNRGLGLNERSGPAIHDNSESDRVMTDRNESLLDDETRERLVDFVRYGEGAVETREADQTIGTAAAGGVFASTILAEEFFRTAQQFGGVRDTRARRFVTETGEDMKLPGVDDVDQSGEQVAEGSSVSSVSNIDMNSVQSPTFMFDSGIVTISVEMLQDAGARWDIENIVTETLANRITRVVEPDLSGSTVTTSTAINGLVTGSTGAVTVTAGSSNLDIQNFRDLFFSVDPIHRSNSEWAMSDSALQGLMDLEDSDGEPLVEPSLQEGEPPRLFGRPIRRVIGLGDVNSSSERPILFGDFREGYMVRDVRDVQIMRYDEKFMNQRKIGLQAFGRFDGRPRFSSTIASTVKPYRAIKTTT